MKTEVGKKAGGLIRKGSPVSVIFTFFLLILLFSSGAVGDKQDTRVSISISPANPPEGVAFTVTGFLTDVSGTPLGNKRITLESSPDVDLT